MSNTFMLPVIYQGQEIELPTQLLRVGFTHKAHVAINGTTVIFEPDEEQNYRAVTDPAFTGTIPTALLQTISETLHALLE